MINKILGTIIGFTGYLIQAIIKKEGLAVKFYRAADKYDNRSALSLASYGLILFKRGESAAALQHFKKMRDATGKDFLDWVGATNMSLCYWKLHRIDEGIAVLEEIKKKYKHLNPDILTTLGYFYMLNGDLEKALEYTNEALEADQEHGPALDNLGQIYFRQDKLEKAEESFKKALDKKENMVDSKYYLGKIYEKQGDKEKAAEYFKQAYNTAISQFSTVTRKQVEQKYREYGIIE
ncbi:MAG: tetratricopeptide repeat protein [Halanaerobiales bacterium]